MNKIKVLFTPSWEKANPYQRLLKESCEAQGCEVSLSNYPSGFFPFYKLVKQYPDLHVLHIHWISELLMRLVWSKSSLLYRVKYLLFALDCWLVKLKGIKIIWTIHNKVAHENQHKERELEVRRLLARQANRLILHSKEALVEINKLYGMSLDYKTEIIFHGNYEGCYPPPSQNLKEPRANLGLKDDDITLLFFGGLKPYKGIETLISAFSEIKSTHLKLVIAGEPYTQEYQQQIESLINQNLNIITHFKFLNDQELSDYLSFSDAVVLPFSDTLTSGSAILAMTFGKALILSESAKVFGCVPIDGASYFDNTKELTLLLDALTLDTLMLQGAANKNNALGMNWKKVGKITTQLYRLK